MISKKIIRQNILTLAINELLRLNLIGLECVKTPSFQHEMTYQNFTFIISVDDIDLGELLISVTGFPTESYTPHENNCCFCRDNAKNYFFIKCWFERRTGKYIQNSCLHHGDMYIVVNKKSIFQQEFKDFIDTMAHADIVPNGFIKTGKVIY